MTYTYEPGRTEGLHLLTGGALSFNFWVGEILLGAVVPIILLLNKRTRALPLWRMLAMLLVVGGVVAYRWDTNLSGLLIYLSYLPGEPTVAYAAYSPFANRNPGRRRNRQLWFAGFQPGSPLPESSGSQYGKNS